MFHTNLTNLYLLKYIKAGLSCLYYNFSVEKLENKKRLFAGPFMARLFDLQISPLF